MSAPAYQPNSHRRATLSRGGAICGAWGARRFTRGWPTCARCCRLLRLRGEQPPVQSNPALTGGSW